MEDARESHLVSNRLTRWAAQRFLRFTGWKSEGNGPAARKFVLIAAPHTTNWDLIYMLAIAWDLDVDISWMGKHTIFRWPFGGLMKYLGGIPVRRNARKNAVEQMTAVFANRSTLALTVPAEGTRSYVPHWKSGFYHIARAAKVPIVLGFLDYSRKLGGFGPEVIPTGNVSEDMDEIRAFYTASMAKYPEAFGDVRLKEEM